MTVAKEKTNSLVLGNKILNSNIIHSIDRVKILDEIEGELASHLYERISDFSQPILLNGSKIQELSPLQQEELVQSLKNGSPVVLIHAQSNQIKSLQEILGLESDVSADYLDIYGVRVNEAGTTEVLNIHPALKEIITHTLNEEDLTASRELNSHAENELQKDRRIDQLMQWLNPPSVSEPTPTLPLLSLAVRESDTTKNLRELAQAYIQTEHFSFRENTYQISTFVWTANAENRDWFFFEQKCLLNAAPAYTHNSGKKKGFYTNSYQFVGTPNQSLAILEQARPETTLESRTATSGTSINLGGTVGFKGGKTAELSTELSGGATFSSSTSFEIPDIKIENNSGNPKINVFNLTYDITEPRWKGPAGAGSTIGTTPKIARATFQPVNTWIWHVPESSRARSPRGFTAQFEFTPNLKQRYVTAARHAKTRTETFKFQVTVPYPPQV